MTEQANISVLALETSGRVGSVALGAGDSLVEARTFEAANSHGVELLPTVASICSRAGLTPDAIRQVYVSAGPGSFTGLRVGVTFAKALAFATGAKVVCVPTLAVIAANALDLSDPPPRVVPVLDAKRKRVYAAAFELRAGGYEPIDEPLERDPAEYLAKQGPAGVLGEGVAIHRTVLEVTQGVTILPESLHRARAENVLALGRKLAAAGQFTDIGKLVPTYIRLPEAVERWKGK